MAPGTPYNGLLLFHGVGVGKTCAAVTIAEMYAGKMKNGVKVVTRRSLVDGFKKALFDPAKVATTASGAPDFSVPTQCTGTAYTDMVVDREMLSLEQIEARVLRKINERYTFYSPITFANGVTSLGKDASGVALTKSVWNRRIRDQFSDSVIIIDEAHSLRGSEAKQMAAALQRVLKLTSNVKLVLLTATPMFNHASDIVSLINMLRSNDKRPPVSLPSLMTVSGVPNSVDAAKLADAVRGYVSYMPGNDPFSFPKRVAPSETGDPLALRSPADTSMLGTRIAADDQMRASLMRWIVASKFVPGGIHERECDLLEDKAADIVKIVDNATGVVDIAEDDIAEDGDDGSDEQESGVSGVSGVSPASYFSTLTTLMQSQNVVFPSGKSGSSGFREAFVTGGNERTVAYRQGVPHLFTPPHIHTYAPKIAAVVERVQKCEGVAIVYSRFIWSGIIPVAIALEHAGFRRYMAAPILRQGQGQGQGRQGGGGRKKRRPPGPGSDSGSATGPGTYAIISSSGYASPLGATLETLTDAANMAGARIKVVLMSDKGSEGITIKYAREVHVLEPWFHLNKIEQVVGRGSRFCSHAGLPPDRQNLTLYLHAMARAGRGSGSRAETLDMYMYRLAARKQRGIDVVETILKQHAVDCNVHAAHHARIKRIVDKNKVTVRTSTGRVLHDQTRDTGVPTCIPKVSPEGIDYSTYSHDLHTHGERLYVDAISGFYGTRVGASYDQLWQHVQGAIPGGVADQARMNAVLERMLKTHAVINGDSDATPSPGESGSGSRRAGFLIHRGSRYMFQPMDDRSTTYLTDAERSLTDAYASTPRRVSLTSLPAIEFRPRAKGDAKDDAEGEAESEGRRRDGEDAPSYATVSHAGTRAVMRLKSAAMLRLQGTRLPNDYAAASLDAEVDRLRHGDILSVGTLLLRDASFRQTWKQVRASLEASGVLDIKAMRIRSPAGGVFVWDASSKSLVEDTAAAAMLPEPRRPNDSAKFLATVSMGSNGAVVFKITEGNGRGADKPSARGAVRTGSVCHQTIMSISKLRKMVLANMDVTALVDRKGETVRETVRETVELLGKRDLCDMYELLIRKHAPRSLLRHFQRV
ncbi:hypothetical protein FOA52_001577 [Chlamydomonas sp. UWO 241]|nr:hypothetical protein FOA52_001577 [Chlamydomonas sp. UWO 241]